MREGQGQPHFPECSLCVWHYVSRALVHSNLTGAPWVATIICTLLEEKGGLHLSEDYRRLKDRVIFDFWESGNATSTCSFHAGKDLGPQTLRRYCWGTWKAHGLGKQAGYCIITGICTFFSGEELQFLIDSQVSCSTPVLLNGMYRNVFL